jgi:hypothetical protein
VYNLYINRELKAAGILQNVADENFNPHGLEIEKTVLIESSAIDRFFN